MLYSRFSVCQSDEEIAEMIGNFPVKPNEAEMKRQLTELPPFNETKRQSYPSSLDYRDSDMVTAVRDQVSSFFIRFTPL